MKEQLQIFSRYKYFISITKSLNISAWNPENSWDNTDLEKFLETFESHPSVRHIKEVTSDLWPLTSDLNMYYHGKHTKLNKNKATSGNIPTKTLKTIAQDIYIPLTDVYKLSYFKWSFSWWTKISRCDTSL